MHCGGQVAAADLRCPRRRSPPQVFNARLPPCCFLQLYDKRKVAALEVEQLVKQLSAAGNVHRISAVIDALVNQYATSSQVRFAML